MSTRRSIASETRNAKRQMLMFKLDPPVRLISRVSPLTLYDLFIHLLTLVTQMQGLALHAWQEAAPLSPTLCSLTADGDTQSRFILLSRRGGVEMKTRRRVSPCIL